MNRWLGTVLLMLLSMQFMGCSATLNVRPTLPPSSITSTSPTRIGVYVTHGPASELEPGSGIWPGTTYHFSAEQTVQEGLVDLTKRHFKNAGVAENSGDKRWDYVLEYNCEKPYVAADDLRSQAPLKFTLRNPQTGREVQSLTLTGEGSPQGKRFLRVIFGRLVEKKALENSLSEAYSNLFVSVDSNLARTGAVQSRGGPSKPYRRRE